MQTAFGVFQNLGYAAANYSMSNTTLAMQKDLKQSLAIGLFAAERIAILVLQMKMHSPSLNFHFRWAPWTMGILAGIALPYAKKYLAKHPHPTTPKEKILTATCKVLKKLGTASYKILQHADTIINVACFVNAIALIVLGFPIAGSIALFGLFILVLKRRLLLPAPLERIMEPICIIGGIATTITMPMHLIFKVLNLMMYAMSISSHIANSKIIRSHLPAHFKNPFHNKHKIQSENKTVATQRAQSNNGAGLKVNPTHVCSDEVGRLLPTECNQSLNAIDANTLFNDLMTQIQQSGITLDETALKGLNNLKVCAVSGRVSDTSPPNIALFQKILKGLLQSILADKANFKIRVEEFADVGNACVEGWTRDITAIFAPETQEIAWAVHHVLSKRRGEIIKDLIRKNNQQFPVLDLAGGSNDIHTTNAAQGAFWHRYRTFEGELDRQLHQPSIMRVLFLRHVFIKKIEKPININIANPKLLPMMFEGAYRGLVATEIHPGLAASPAGGAIGGMMSLIEPEIDDAVRDSEATVNAIYDAIKPEYAMAPSRIDPANPKSVIVRVDPKRVIAWKGVLAWIGDIATNRNIDICDPITGNYDPIWVEHDMADQPYLSKAGVRLLLWDLGILTTL